MTKINQTLRAFLLENYTHDDIRQIANEGWLSRLEIATESQIAVNVCLYDNFKDCIWNELFQLSNYLNENIMNSIGQLDGSEKITDEATFKHYTFCFAGEEICRSIAREIEEGGAE